jgi:hypothetical protein
MEILRASAIAFFFVGLAVVVALLSGILGLRG